MSLKDEIDGHTVLAGLLAHPAGHSMSPAMYNATFEKLGLNDAYLSFDVDAPELAHALQAMRSLHFWVVICRCRISKRPYRCWTNFRRPQN